MAETFKLPVSSYEELIKVIQAYSSEKEGTILSLDDLSQSTGMPRTVVSSNNGFLVQIGLITEGNKKAAKHLRVIAGRPETGRAIYGSIQCIYRLSEKNRAWNNE